MSVVLLYSLNDDTLILQSERAKKWKERLEKKSKAKKMEEKVSEKKLSDAELRKNMINAEFSSLIKQTEENELEEPFEKETVEALQIAADKLAYLKKYYNSFTDKFVYFPSVAKLVENNTLFEEGRKNYFDDEFPLKYSAALRSVACEKLDDGNDDDEDDYMVLFAADVEL